MGILAVGLNEIFDEVVRYLKRAYPECCKIKLTYLNIKENEEDQYYFGEIQYQGDESPNSGTFAVFKADPKNGTIFHFQEGVEWKHKP